MRSFEVCDWWIPMGAHGNVWHVLAIYESGRGADDAQ